MKINDLILKEKNIIQRFINAVADYKNIKEEIDQKFNINNKRISKRYKALWLEKEKKKNISINKKITILESRLKTEDLYMKAYEKLKDNIYDSGLSSFLGINDNDKNITIEKLEKESSRLFYNISRLMDKCLIKILPFDLRNAYIALIFLSFFLILALIPYSSMQSLTPFKNVMMIIGSIFFSIITLYLIQLKQINKIVKFYLIFELLCNKINLLYSKKLYDQYISSLNKINSKNKHNYINNKKEVQNNFQHILKSIKNEVFKISENLNIVSPEWSDKKRLSTYFRLKTKTNKWYDCNSSHGYPILSRFGEFNLKIDKYNLPLPAFFYFPGNKNILFKIHNTHRDFVISTVKSILLRLLTIIPPGKFRFVFIDPVALGQNVAPFLHLSDYDEELISKKVWTEKQHIEKKLTDLTEHMGNVIQKYLRNQFENIEDFNKEAGEVAEPYRILIVMDFPANFTEESAQRLISIVQNGPRCGIYTFIVWNTEQALPYNFSAKPLEESMILIDCNHTEKIFKWQDPDFQNCTLELEQAPDDELFQKIITWAGKASLNASKVEVPFEKILERSELISENWWKGSTEKGINIPLGPVGANKIQYLDMGNGTSQHMLIAGKTGSGKSTLLHILITTLAITYSPEEVELYLIDFKKGVEFKTYATHELPHARVIAIDSEREFGLSVLEGLDIEMKRRGDIFRDKGVDNVQNYRWKTGTCISRIVLLVDEFQEFFTEDDSISSRSSQILDRLVRQGRAFGIHVLLGSQTLAGTYTLARSTIDQIAIRIALQCSEADSRLILSDDNPAARLLSRPGEAIYNSANGLIEGNSLFQIAWLSDDKQFDYLDKIKKLAKQKGFFPPETQIVFEGNESAIPEKHHALNNLLSNPIWSKNGLKKFSAYLGEPVEIKDVTVAFFRSQSGSNLITIGQNDESAMSILMINLLSLAAQHAPDSAKFYILDFGSVDSNNAGYLANLKNIIPHNVEHGRRRKLTNIISQIADEVEYRLRDEETGLHKKPSVYLFIYGLQRARDLQKEDNFGKFSFTNPDEPPLPPNPAERFPKILREGPDLGIHTIIWCDTVNNMNRKLDRQTLREFEMRVAFQMSSEDSINLIDTPGASKLGQQRALFYNEEEGRMEKFRPYKLPSEDWLNKIGKNFISNNYK